MVDDASIGPSSCGIVSFVMAMIFSDTSESYRLAFSVEYETIMKNVLDFGG